MASKLEKIYHLHEILSARRTPVDRHELMDRLECSQATLYRLIASLRDELGAPVEQDDKSRFYYDRELPSFELPGIWLSSQELYALMAARSLLERLQPGLFDEELGELRRRIEALLKTTGASADAMRQRIRIIHHGGRDVPRELFRQVLQGLIERRRLDIEYRARTSGQTTGRQISPQRLTSYRENWYLDAWCHMRGGLRSFALERIAALTVSGEVAEEVDDETLSEHFQAAYGIFAGPAEYEAILRFSPEVARWVADERWHSKQRDAWLEDGTFERRLPYGRSEELVMDILRYGADVEVIGPEALRDEVRDRARAIADLYA